MSKVERYYTGRFTEHGASACGVDWNSPESQELRFTQLLKVCDTRRPFSLNDFGCGYGAMVSVLEHLELDVAYRGFDLSVPMLDHARMTYGRRPR